jgi:hypothetical protein
MNAAERPINLGRGGQEVQSPGVGDVGCTEGAENTPRARAQEKGTPKPRGNISKGRSLTAART